LHFERIMKVLKILVSWFLPVKLYMYAFMYIFRMDEMRFTKGNILTLLKFSHC
jgi:hypothetical protein